MLPRTLSADCTEAEFLSLPESHDHIELIDGEVLLSPSPSYEHQLIVLALAERFRAWARANPPAAISLAPLDLHLRPGVIVQPDLFVVAAGLPRAHQGPVDRRPELVVEVSSENRSYDRLTKRHLYAEAAIPEYWIVDRRERRIEVVRGLETVALVEQGDVECASLTGLTVAVADLF